MGAEQGIVEKSGAWFSFGGERLGQGRDNARVFLKEHPEIRQRIDTGLREKIGLAKPESAGAKPVAAEPVRSASAQTA
jgi:recombination protein RecA